MFGVHLLKASSKNEKDLDSASITHEKKDKEAEHLGLIYLILSCYDIKTRKRMLRWINSRIESDIKKVT